MFQKKELSLIEIPKTYDIMKEAEDRQKTAAVASILAPSQTCGGLKRRPQPEDSRQVHEFCGVAA